MTTHILDNSAFYWEASSGTGAAHGDFFLLNADNIDASINGLGGNLMLLAHNNDTLIQAHSSGGDYIYTQGNSDAIAQVDDGSTAIIDLGSQTILDVQNNLNGFDVLYNQPNDPGFSLMLPKTGFSGAIFIAGIQMTAADLSKPNANGVQTLSILNNGQTVDKMNIIGLQTGGTLNLANAQGGVYLSQTNPFVHQVTV